MTPTATALDVEALAAAIRAAEPPAYSRHRAAYDRALADWTTAQVEVTACANRLLETGQAVDAGGCLGEARLEVGDVLACVLETRTPPRSASSAATAG